MIVADCPLPQDCGGVKLSKKKQITTIHPPDYPISMIVGWNSVAGTAAQNPGRNTSFRLNIGWAPGRSVGVPVQVVPSETYARQNGGDTETPLFEETFAVQNARTPYWEGGLQLTNLSFADLNGITSGREIALTYLDIIPLGFRYELAKRLSVGAGASFSVLMNATQDGREVADLATAGFNDIEPGLIFNAQFGKRGGGLKAGVSYNLRFAQLSGSNLRYGFTQFSLGWGFGARER